MSRRRRTLWEILDKIGVEDEDKTRHWYGGGGPSEFVGKEVSHTQSVCKTHEAIVRHKWR